MHLVKQKKPKEKVNIESAGNTLRAYQHLIAQGSLKPNKVQETLIKELDLAAQMLEAKENRRETFSLSKFFSKPTHTANYSGIYIHGEVGRGKSMAMDLFFEHVEIKKKRRVHFHRFMAGIHTRLRILRGNLKIDDALSALAGEVAKDVRLLCFDEFQVTDIADAMILSRFFTLLFEDGVFIVSTSNSAPENLYKDGLNRTSFLPFIEVVKQQMKVIHLGGNSDYRFRQLKALKTVYFYPLGAKSDQFMRDSFKSLSHGTEAYDVAIKVQGRAITARGMYGDMLWCDFEELCTEPRGSADYLELASEFRTLLLSNVPQLSPVMKNEARRLTTLIDTLYEHGVKVIMSAASAPNMLYTEGRYAKEFERTVSRMMEMQAGRYLERVHKR